MLCLVSGAAIGSRKSPGVTRSRRDNGLERSHFWGAGPYGVGGREEKLRLGEMGEKRPFSVLLNMDKLHYFLRACVWPSLFMVLSIPCEWCCLGNGGDPGGGKEAV